MKKTYLQRGFTLIELLVVIAIIGILSSVVLASLNTARSKGADAAIKSNLANIRPQAEITYDAQGGYGDGTGTPVAFTLGACASTADTLFAEPTVAGQIAAAKAANGASSLNACASIITSGGAWAVAQQLKQTTGDVWCVDSTGRAKLTSSVANTQAGVSGVINGTTAACI
jgi:prepilin-type N-terminal cleavage/methylation domain-containing protein